MASEFDEPKQYKSWKYRCAELIDKDACTAADKCSYSDMHQVCIPKKVAFAQSAAGIVSTQYEPAAIRQAVGQARAHAVKDALDKKCYEASSAAACTGNCEYNFWENECLPKHIAARIGLTSKLFKKSEVVSDYLKRHRALRSVKGMKSLSRIGMATKLIGVAGITALIGSNGLDAVYNVGHSAVTNKFMQDSVKSMLHNTKDTLHAVLQRLYTLGMEEWQVTICASLVMATLAVLRHRKTSDDLTKEQVKENKAWESMDTADRREYVAKKVREERGKGLFTTRFRGLSTDDVNGPLHVATGIKSSDGIVGSIWKMTFGRMSAGGGETRAHKAMRQLKERQVPRFKQLRRLKEKMRRLNQSDAAQREQYAVLHREVEELRKKIYHDSLFMGEELVKVLLIAVVVAGSFYITYTKQPSWTGIAVCVGIMAVLLFKVMDYLYGPTEAKSLVRFFGNSVRTVGRIIRAVYKAVNDLFVGDAAGTY